MTNFDYENLSNDEKKLIQQQIDDKDKHYAGDVEFADPVTKAR